MVANKILCVAEKPSIAKAVANHLSRYATARNVPHCAWLKNYEFDFDFGPPWGHCPVVMTCVAGHLQSLDFDHGFRSWSSCSPAQLFDAPVVRYVDQDKKPVEKNIRSQARYAKALFIWTDCDREGEHIGAEIRGVALDANRQLDVRRARFSNIEKNHVIQAAKNPITLDDRQAEAVSTRIELDLRIGACFTRMQTLQLKPMVDKVQEVKVISYGSCQFPTLGFVVERYLKVQNFVPEKFWKIDLMHKRDDVEVKFKWRRGHLFDRMVVAIIFERCLDAKHAKVTKLQTKPTSKWKPLPLTTVELQKLGSRFLRMTSQEVMKVAETLYTRGFISYPRTETDQFDTEIDLRSLVEKQSQDPTWGVYAAGLLNGAFRQPRAGRNNDRAHPPIHPVNPVEGTGLSAQEKRVYEFIVRRFLACCSEDAKGQTTTIELTYGSEIFSASGLTVLERNYLDVYPYDKWQSSQELPKFEADEVFVPTQVMMNEGKTSPPNYLTEPELIALMDANGIGTDATMAEHIQKIKDRDYIRTQTSNRATDALDHEDIEEEPVRPAPGRGRGRGRGRGGTTVGSRSAGNDVLIPTTLGMALIAGYDKFGFETSLSKPFLRKEMELQMKAICEGRSNQQDVIYENIEKYREVYYRVAQNIDYLKGSIRQYLPIPN